MLKFEDAQIVRGGSTRSWSDSIKGTSYEGGVRLRADARDHGQMVYDFGLPKGGVRDWSDAFGHAVAVWSQDDPDYIASIRRHSERWVLIPVSPSAEQFSRLIFRLVEAALENTQMKNGESGVQLHSVIVHETETGYAQCFREDVVNPRMGLIDLDLIEFSPAITAQWADPKLYKRLKPKPTMIQTELEGLCS